MWMNIIFALTIHNHRFQSEKKQGKNVSIWMIKYVIIGWKNYWNSMDWIDKILCKDVIVYFQSLQSGSEEGGYTTRSYSVCRRGLPNLWNHFASDTSQKASNGSSFNMGTPGWGSSILPFTAGLIRCQGFCVRHFHRGIWMDMNWQLARQ